MMWAQMLVLMLLALAVHRAPATRPAPPPAITKYVLAILGDSLSDTGNTLRAANVPDTTYFWHGRFTDGPNWVDYLQSAIPEQYPLEVINYAYGGATACAQDSIAVSYPYVKNLTSQTAAFAADLATGKVPTGRNVMLTVVQWVGGNDILAGLSGVASGSPLTETLVTQLVQSLVSCRIASVRATAALPGVKAIVIMPIAPLYAAPVVPALYKLMVRVVVALLERATEAAVAQLQSVLNATGSGVKLYVMGNSTWIEQGFTAISPKYKHLDDTCLISPTNSLTPKVNGSSTLCSNPTEHLFFDGSHPETRFHLWFALKGFLPRMQRLRLLP